MPIRLATNADMEEINKMSIDLPHEERVLFHASVTPSKNQFWGVTRSPIFVIENLAIENSLIGYLRTDSYCDHLTVRLCGLFVRPEMRGKWYATALVKHAIEYFKKQWIWKIIDCRIVEGNKASMKVHLDLWFKKAWLYKKEIWDGEKYLWMHRLIYEF